MNKKGVLRLLSILLFIALLTPSLSSCKRLRQKEYYLYFDTVSIISDYSKGSKASFTRATEEFEKRLEYFHKLFDIYNEYDGMNNIATINRLAGKEAVTVDYEIINLIEFSIKMQDATNGNVNIAMGSVLSIWHKYREAGVTIPTSEELASAAEHTDISKIVIDKENSTVYLSDPQMSLDVGAIAKGYAAEVIARNLEGLGYTSYVLDIGGNLRAIGTKPDGSSWRTGVQNPNPYSPEPYVYYLDVADTSVVTSGDYQRYYTVDGKRYHHIINKDTLMPAEHFSSVTVLTKDSGVADALSTALFNMDHASGVAMLSKFDDVSVVWVTRDGEVKTYGLGE